jgi:hypothetical protein
VAAVGRSSLQGKGSAPELALPRRREELGAPPLRGAGSPRRRREELGALVRE